MNTDVPRHLPDEAVEAAGAVLASWGVRSRHGEWTDQETQEKAAQEALEAALPHLRKAIEQEARDSIVAYVHAPRPESVVVVHSAYRGNGYPLCWPQAREGNFTANRDDAKVTCIDCWEVIRSRDDEGTLPSEAIAAAVNAYLEGPWIGVGHQAAKVMLLAALPHLHGIPDDEDKVRVPREAVEALRRAHPARPGRDMAPVDHFLRAAVNDR